MSNPVLLVVAGCNGSGKSTYSQLLASSDFVPFDYDRHYISFYKSLFDSDVREVMAHNMAREELERQVATAIHERRNFCYETNFNSTPLFWPERFRQNGYELRMVFLCLNTISEAQKRVAIRVQNGGHFVSDTEIEKRYYDGFSNLNLYFSYFDVVHIFDSSAHMVSPRHLMSLVGGKMVQRTDCPRYLKKLIPTIAIL